MPLISISAGRCNSRCVECGTVVKWKWAARARSVRCVVRGRHGNGSALTQVAGADAEGNVCKLVSLNALLMKWASAPARPRPPPAGASAATACSRNKPESQRADGRGIERGSRRGSRQGS